MSQHRLLIDGSKRILGSEMDQEIQEQVYPILLTKNPQQDNKTPLRQNVFQAFRSLLFNTKSIQLS